MRLVAPLHLAVGFWTFARDVLMGDAQVRRCQVNWDPNDKSLSVSIFWIAGEMLPHLPEKLDRHPRIVLIVDPQNPEPSRFLELVEALAYPRCAPDKITSSWTERPGLWSDASCRRLLWTPEKATSLTDIPAHALRMRRHAQPGLQLNLLVNPDSSF